MWLYKVGGAGWKGILPEQRSVLLGTRHKLQGVGPLIPAQGPKAAVVVDLQMLGWKAPAGLGRR